MVAAALAVSLATIGVGTAQAEPAPSTTTLDDGAGTQGLIEDGLGDLLDLVAKRRASLSVATYNVRHRIAGRTTAADVTKLARRGLDIISLQEMGSRTKRDAVLDAVVDCRRCGYDAYMPSRSAMAAVPILYRRDTFRLLDSGTEPVSRRTFVGSSGAGPRFISAKYVNWVKLRELRTGRVVYVLNSHAVASVQGKRGLATHKRSARLSLYRRHMVVLQRLVEEFQQRRVTILVTGDLNVNYRRDRVMQDPRFPYARLGKVGLEASYEALGEPRRGTHDRGRGRDDRLIDYVYHSPWRKFRPTDQQILMGFSSDHRPLQVTYALRR